MGKILVFSEFLNQQGQIKLKKSALELLSAAQESGQEVIALALGPDSSQLASEVGSYGVKTLWVCEDPQLKAYNPQVYTHFLAELLKTQGPDLVLGSSTALGVDLFPRVAARVGGSTISDCTELKLSGGQIEVRRPMYAGKCTAAADLLASPKMVLMRANQLPLKPGSGGGAATVEKLALPALDLATLVKDVVKGTSEKLDLTEANIIVSGGRGLGEAGAFKLLEELADVLGATVGASRAVVDAGWVPHSMQVGQTGKTVAPSLYIAVGISGMIQHLAGMSGAKVVVDINKDGNAPIFQKATYGIVGEAADIVPKLTAEFKKVLNG